MIIVSLFYFVVLRKIQGISQQAIMFESKVGKVSTNFAAAKNGKVSSKFSAAKNGQVSSNSKKR